MSFTICPDAVTAAMLGKPERAPLSLVATEAMRKFVPLADLVGPDPTVGGQPTTFVRIAMSGKDASPLLQPTFEVLAHDPDRPGGGPALRLDPNTAVSLATAVTLSDNVNNTGAAMAYFSPPFSDNVYLLRLAIEIPGTRLWIRITNTTGTDPNVDKPRRFVWVVADNEADTQQPWIHATSSGTSPTQINFNASIRQTSAQTMQVIEIDNSGTGPVMIESVEPAVTPPYVLSGLPVSLRPNPRLLAEVSVGFNAPGTPGDLAPAVFRFIADRPDPGPFGPDHTNQFILSAHTSSLVWVTRAPMPTARQSPGLAAAPNGMLYAIGGFVDDHSVVTVEQYDPATAKAAMPTSRSGLALVAANNGRIFVVGGESRPIGGQFVSALRIVEEYDPATDTWATKAPMPTGRSGLGLVATSNGKLYAIGGSDGQNQLAVVEEYDLPTDTWTTRMPMPTSRTGFGLAAASNGRIYAVGGFSGPKNIGTVEEYDPATNSWTTKTSMPTSRRDLGLASAGDDTLYAVGGLGGLMDVPITTVEEYDPFADSWVVRPSLPVEAGGLGLTVAGNGKLYAVGGFGFAGFSNATQGSL